MVLKLALITALAAIVCARTPRREYTAPAVPYAYFAAAPTATAPDYAENSRVTSPALYYTATPSPLEATTAPTVSYAAPSNVKITASHGVSYATPAPTAYRVPVTKTIIGTTSAPGNYELEYAVNKPQTDQAPHHGDVVQGTYATVNPDGSKPTVPYSGEALNVLNAIVRKQPITIVAPATSTVHHNNAVAQSAPPTVSYTVSPLDYKYTSDVDRFAVSVVSIGAVTPITKSTTPAPTLSYGFVPQRLSNGATAPALGYDTAAPAYSYRYVSPAHFNSAATPSLSNSYAASGLSNEAAARAFLNAAAAPTFSNVVASPGFFNGVVDPTVSNVAASSAVNNVATAPAFEAAGHYNSAATPSLSNGVTAPAFGYVAAAPVRNEYVAPVYSNSAPSPSYGYAAHGLSQSAIAPAFLNPIAAPPVANSAVATALGQFAPGSIFSNGYVTPTLSNTAPVPVFNYRYGGSTALKIFAPAAPTQGFGYDATAPAIVKIAAPALSYGYGAAASTDPKTAAPVLNYAVRYNSGASLENSKLSSSGYLSNTLYK